MLSFGRRRIFLCRQAVDMRKAFDSLSDYVRCELGMDPFQGDVFVFVGKDRTRAKVLVWEPTGFWLCAKRLETSRFQLSVQRLCVRQSVCPSLDMCLRSCFQPVPFHQRGPTDGLVANRRHEQRNEDHHGAARRTHQGAREIFL